MALSADMCDYCGEGMDDLDEDARVSCDCKGLTVCRECFEGEDGIKEHIGVTDSPLLAPFLTGEPGSQVVAGYANKDSIACVDCVGAKQHIGFTQRKDGKGKGAAGKASSDSSATGVSRAQSKPEVVQPVDMSAWPEWAEQCELILEDITLAGPKPNDVAKASLWRSISRAPSMVITLAKQHLSWTEDRAVWGGKSDWKAFSQAVADLTVLWKNAAPVVVPATPADNTLDFISMAKTKLSQAKNLEGKSARSLALHDFLLEAPTVVQNPFVAHLGWCRKNCTFSTPDDGHREDTVRVLDAMAGVPSAPGVERLLKQNPVREAMVSLRDEGVEEEHLLRGGSRFEGQSRLAEGGAGMSLRQQDIRQGLGVQSLAMSGARSGSARASTGDDTRIGSGAAGAANQFAGMGLGSRAR
eukprot:CAMPEP_0181302890 /NCGR_PEP_ID=MMETSP1101-20121128/8245_1 /TAXON_ID=46948 /ORGANISM="Rhodomonas abbreviata, Strain Caron Lab Isolate" /LENGTH=412 /DNA_ID=CAMNT_0023408385 /DNA_START=671 /DNA_END=1906 /DNA_ORIENTATION=+